MERETYIQTLLMLRTVEAREGGQGRTLHEHWDSNFQDLSHSNFPIHHCMRYSFDRVKWQTNSGISRRQDCLFARHDSISHLLSSNDRYSFSRMHNTTVHWPIFSFLPFFLFLSFNVVKEVTHILLIFTRYSGLLLAILEALAKASPCHLGLPESWKLTSRELLICRRGGGVGCKAPCDHLWGKQWLASKYPLVSKSR